MHTRLGRAHACRTRAALSRTLKVICPALCMSDVTQKTVARESGFSAGVSCAKGAAAKPAHDASAAGGRPGLTTTTCFAGLKRASAVRGTAPGGMSEAARVIFASAI